jgi:hypothetical protein
VQSDTCAYVNSFIDLHPAFGRLNFPSFGFGYQYMDAYRGWSESAYHVRPDTVHKVVKCTFGRIELPSPCLALQMLALHSDCLKHIQLSSQVPVKEVPAPSFADVIFQFERHRRGGARGIAYHPPLRELDQRFVSGLVFSGLLRRRFRQEQVL